MQRWAWVDQVLREHKLLLNEVMDMLGDKNATIPRMLAGYQFVNQLIAAGSFGQDQSQRKGRGSNPDYPFSLGLYSARQSSGQRVVGFKETDGVPAEEPVPSKKLEDAGWIMTFMFGDKNRGVAAVVDDSRENREIWRRPSATP